MTRGITNLDTYPLWTGDEPAGNLGDSVAIGGDLDGDGLGDAFLGAHTSRERWGRGYVATDKDGGPAAESHAVFAGSQELDWMGCAAAFGDFDGDGHDDFAIGIPTDSYFDTGRPGRVAVYRGPLSAGTRTDLDADAVFRGSDLKDGFGLRMDAGDVDGDGRADLVVGAPRDDTMGTDAGAVYLVLAGGLLQL